MALSILIMPNNIKYDSGLTKIKRLIRIIRSSKTDYAQSTQLGGAHHSCLFERVKRSIPDVYQLMSSDCLGTKTIIYEPMFKFSDNLVQVGGIKANFKSASDQFIQRLDKFYCCQGL